MSTGCETMFSMTNIYFHNTQEDKSRKTGLISSLGSFTSYI